MRANVGGRAILWGLLLLLTVGVIGGAPAKEELTFEEIVPAKLDGAYSAEICLLEYGASSSRETQESLQRYWRHGGIGARLALHSQRDVSQCLMKSLKGARFRPDDDFLKEPRYLITLFENEREVCRFWADPDGNIIGDKQVYVLNSGSKNWLKQTLHCIAENFFGCLT